MLKLRGKMFFPYFLTLVVSVMAQQKVEEPDGNLAYDYELYESVLDPELCETQLQQMRAFEFYDASFRIPQSIFKGGTFSLGNYHQCLGIRQPLEDSIVEGKYCLIETKSLNLPIFTGNSWPGNVTWTTLQPETLPDDYSYKAYAEMKRSVAIATGDLRVTDGIIIANAVQMTLAVCIPRPCRVADVLAPLTDNPLVEFNYTELQCRLPDDKPFSGADITALVVFSVIGLLTLLSSAYELHHIFIKKETSKPSELLSCFSVYCNTDRLMTISSKAGALDCLDGIRTFSILWVITGHSFLLHLTFFVMNPIDINNWTSRLDSVWLTAANVSVDSFFTLSGLLLVYTAANKMKPKQLMSNLHLFYLNRLLRMFPLLAAAVLLQASVLNQVADGVRWDIVARETQKCRDYWWTALLHVQNIVNPREYCLPHSWYLSVDVQLHILSPIILFWVLGSKRSAWSSLTLGILGTLTATVVYSLIKEFSGSHDWYFTVYFYHNTMTRSPVFVIGMFTGYLLHVSRGRKVKIPAWLVMIGYALAVSMSSYCLYQRNAPWDSQLWISLNIALMRSAWAMSLCWLIYACVNGYGGPVNWFLSLKMWKFTARISYAMYIFHYPMQFVISGANTLPSYFSFEGIFLLVASDITYTIIVSIAACVLIDAPFSTLQRMLMAAIAPAAAPPKPAQQAEVATETNGLSEPKPKEEKQHK